MVRAPLTCEIVHIASVTMHSYTFSNPKEGQIGHRRLHVTSNGSMLRMGIMNSIRQLEGRKRKYLQRTYHLVTFLALVGRRCAGLRHLLPSQPQVLQGKAAYQAAQECTTVRQLKMGLREVQSPSLHCRPRGG